MITSLFKIKPLARFIRQLITLSGPLSLTLLSVTPAAGNAASYAAITVAKNETVIVNDDDRITVVGSENRLCGICNDVGATNGTINLGNNVTIDVDGPVAGAIMLAGNDSTLQAKQLNIHVNGHYGIQVDASNAQLDLGRGSRIDLNNNTLLANGIYLSNRSLLSADALTINTHGVGSGLYITDAGTRMDIGNDSLIQTQGAQATGVYIFGRDNGASGVSASLQANRLTITTAGNSAYGMNIQANSTVNLGRGSRIETLGAEAKGIWNLGELTADELHIKTTGGNLANALEVREQGVATIGAGSSLYSKGSGALVASGEAATINFNGSATQRNYIFAEDVYAVSAQSEGSSINLSWSDIDIRRSNNLAIGIWAQGGGRVQGDNLSITGNSGAIGVYAMTDSGIDLTGKTVIRMASPQHVALGTQHNLGYRASRISLSGLIDIIGSVDAVGGIIALDMAAGSQLTGMTANDGVNGGYLNIKMHQSQWNMPGNSVVNNLTLSDSTINFLTEEAGTRLTVDNLAGSGTFALTTDIAASRSDQLVVTGSSAGSHYLQIRNRGEMQTTGQEVVTVVKTADGQARFALSPSTEKVELGGYLYGLQQAGANWQLAATGAAEPEPTPEPEFTLPEPDPVLPEPTPTPEQQPEEEEEELEITPQPIPIPEEELEITPQPIPVPEEELEITPQPIPVPEEELEITPQPAPSPGTPEITNAADAGANFLNIGYLINYAEIQSMLQRFGDLRQKQSLGDGWIRGMGGRFDDFGSGKLSGFKLNYSGIQFGVDKQVAPETPVTLGAFMGVTNGNAHYASGKGDQTSRHAGLYISALADNGLWFDGVAKYARMKNSFSVRDSQGQSVSGAGAANSYSVSLESGKRFTLTPAAEGLYLEPQLQVAWSHQQADRLRASNGLRVDLDSYSSLLGRASALLGYRVDQDALQLNVYLKSGVIREFRGETGYRLNGSPERHSFKGNGWNNGVGISASIADQHVIYMEGDSTTGQRFNQRQFSAGYRFSF